MDAVGAEEHSRNLPKEHRNDSQLATSVYPFWVLIVCKPEFVLETSHHDGIVDEEAPLASNHWRSAAMGSIRLVIDDTFNDPDLPILDLAGNP